MKKNYLLLGLFTLLFIVSCEKEESKSPDKNFPTEENVLEKGVTLKNFKKFVLNYSQTKTENGINIADFANRLDLSESYLTEDKDGTVFMAPVRTPESYARNLVLIRREGFSMDFTITYPDRKNKNIFYVTNLKDLSIQKIEIGENGKALDNHIQKSGCEESIFVQCSSGQHSFNNPEDVWNCQYWTDISAGSPPQLFKVAGSCDGGGSGGESGGGSPGSPTGGSGGGGTSLPPGGTDLPPLTHSDCEQNLDCEDCNLPGDINNDCQLNEEEITVEEILFEELGLNATEQAWLDNATFTRRQNLKDFLLENQNSSEAQAFAKEAIGAGADGTLISFFPFFKYPPGSSYASDYPKLTEYLKNKMPLVKDISVITDAIQDITDLSLSQIQEDLQWGKGPTIIISQLDDYSSTTGADTAGLFDGENSLETLYLDIDFVNRLENEEFPDQEFEDAYLFFLSVTILHEYVHYGDYLNGNNYQYPQEEGNMFETRVYGEDVNQGTLLFIED